MERKSTKQWLNAIVAGVMLGASMAAMAAGSRAFVPMGSADAIGVIDLESYQVMPSIPNTLNTHGSALTPDGRYLIAGSLTPRDTKENVSPPEGVTEDEHAAHHGGGEKSAANQQNTGVLYMVDTTTNAIVRKLEVPGPVHHVLVTADGRYAVSTHPMGGSISVVSLDSGKHIETVATGPNPNYVVESEDGQSLLVSNAGNGTVSEIDTQHWFVERNLRVGGSPEHMVLSRDNQRLYVNDDSAGRVVVIDLPAGSVTGEYEVGDAPHGVGLSPDGQILYATSQGDDRLVRITLDDGTRQSITLSTAPYHLAVVPDDGRLLVTSREESKLWVLDPASLEVLYTISLDGIGHQISLDTR
ncbi:MULTISPECIES: YncE family protein [Halomonadaceae]|uniref:YncE family protein n=1 Tax=Halomonadaceae TaxID=28256 RepID=UPI001583831F|nr:MULTISPECIES: YncE family protein [Halomonas]MDI4638292.1 YncE family protein [Halomonas sp. BMC7]NUJ59283.1 YncE family protein [Halomonas taeanensis]